MAQETWTSVDEYIERLLVGPDDALVEALEASDRSGLPAIAVSASQGKFLHLLAAACRARSILEIGTLGGYSAIWLARALPADGRLVTLELEGGHAEVARSNLERAGVGNLVDIRVGPAAEWLEKLAEEDAGPFDLVFIDADKAGYPSYLEGVLPLCRPGSLIVADNVVREGEVLDASSTDEAVQGVRRFNELLASDPRCQATIVQTVGVKGYDGLAVAMVVS